MNKNFARWHATYIKNPTQKQLASYYGVYDIFDNTSIFVINHPVHGEVAAAFTNIPDALMCFSEHNIKQGIPNTAKLSDLGITHHPIMLIESKISRRLIPSV